MTRTDLAIDVLVAPPELDADVPGNIVQHMWLREACTERGQRAQEAERCLDGLPDKNTPYARAVAALAAAHRAAEEVYARALERA